MNQTYSNRLSAWVRKATTLLVFCFFGLSIFTASADARLIFTTEGDGNLVDQDEDGDGNYSLFFGSALEAEIEFDTTNDRFNINKDVRVDGDVVTTGAVTVGTNLTVTGTSDLQGNVSNTTGRLTFDDGVDVTGDLDVQGGDITLQNDETISNSVDGTVAITAANTTTSGALDVQGGDITLQNDETISNSVDGTVAITAANTTTSGALDVQGGDITLQNDETISNAVDGTVTIDATSTEVTGGLDVQGGDIVLQNDETISNSTDGTIDITATDTTTTGNVNVGNNLDVTGTSTLDGNVTLNNDSQIINLRAENSATLAGAACTAASLGRIYYNTDTEDLLYCKETAPGAGTFAWTSVASGAATDVTTTFYPEFGSFSVWADGSNNRGTLRAEYDDTDDRSYYLWRTRRATQQDYDLVLQWQVPDNFSEFKSAVSNHLQFDIETVGANAQVDLRDVQVNGADQSISDTANTAATWTTQDVDLSGATVSAGDTMTFRFTLFGQSGGSISSLSNVKINYTQQ